MSRIGLFGPQGSGKTLLGMMFCRMIQAAYPEVDLYTNVNAYGKNVYTIKDMIEFPFNRDRPKILYMDEAMFSVNARNASSNINQAWSMALALFRKSNVVLSIYATHRPKMMDVNFRDQLQYSVMCRKTKADFSYLMVDMVMYAARGFTMPRSKPVFDFANYDTHDYPLPIEVIELVDKHPLFQMKKIEKKKVAAKEIAL